MRSVFDLGHLLQVLVEPVILQRILRRILIEVEVVLRLLHGCVVQVLQARLLRAAHMPAVGILILLLIIAGFVIVVLFVRLHSRRTL